MARIDENNMKRVQEEGGDYFIPKYEIHGSIIGVVIGYAICSAMITLTPLASFVCMVAIGSVGSAVGKEITTLNNPEYFDDLNQNLMYSEFE